MPDKFTASFFCSTDTENNQIASFYIGAMANASELSLRTISQPGPVIISPNDPGAMVQYAEECRTIGVPFIFDPGQQCARLSGDELRDGIKGARLVISNDYEFELFVRRRALGRTAFSSKRPRWSSRAVRTALPSMRRTDVATSRRSLPIASSIRPASAMPSVAA